MSSETPRASGRLLVVLFLGVLMAALDIAIVGPALPALRDYFGVDERTIAWVFNTFVLFNLVGLPVMAKMSDVFGRRNIYVLDVALFAAGSVIVALAPSFGVLLVGRGLQGLGASGIFPVASAVVGDVFPPERRGRALGLLGAVFGIAFIIGPIMAGILLLFNWRWLFLVSLPLAAFVGLYGFRLLPPKPPHRGARALDVPGIVVLGLLLGATAYGISRLDTSTLLAGLASLQVWPFLLLAAVLLPVFVRIERRADEPLLRLQLFSNRQVVIASMLAAGAGLTEVAFVFFPALAVAAFDVTKSTASFMLLPLVTAVAVGAPVAGRLIDRVGSRQVVIVSMVLLTAGLGIMGLLAESKALYYTGSVLIGVGLSGVLGSSLSYILLAEAEAAERTVAQGVITLFMSIGQLLGGAFIGAVVSSGTPEAGSYMRAFLFISMIALVLTALSFGLKRRAAERQTLRREANT